MRRQLVPAVLMMVVFTLSCSASLPARRHRDRARWVQRQGQRLARRARRRGGRLEPHRPGVHRRGGQAAAGVLPVAAVGRRRRRGETVAGYDPTLSLARTSDRPTPSCLQGGRGSGCEDYRELNGLDEDTPVPVDAVTASGSGLDPHISVANARLQAARSPTSGVWRSTRSCDSIDDHTDGRTLGFLGEKRVNVLELNLALDESVEADRRLTAWRAAGSASTSGPRRAWARPSPCSTRAGGATHAAPTSWSASSRPTVGRTPPRRSATSRSCRARRSSYRGSTFEEMDVDAVLARQARAGAGRRARAHERARIPQREALAGRRRAPRRRHRRDLDR